MVKNIPVEKITTGATKVVNKKSPDAIFLAQNPDVVFVDGVNIVSRNVGVNVTSNGSANPDPAATVPVVPVVPIKKDIPNISDIELKTMEQYYDPVSKLAKYKIILKVRNSSTNPTNVIAVDARIKDPNGA